MSNIKNLIDQADLHGWKNSDKDSVQIYTIDSRQILVKKFTSRMTDDDVKYLIENSKKAFEQGVNIARVLDYKSDIVFCKKSERLRRQITTLQDLAPGIDMMSIFKNPTLAQQFAQEPVATFDKFAKNFLELDKNWFLVDNNPENMFFSPEKITFIDLNGKLGERKLDLREVFSSYAKYIERNNIPENIMSVIMGKFMKAADSAMNVKATKYKKASTLNKYKSASAKLNNDINNMAIASHLNEYAKMTIE